MEVLSMYINIAAVEERQLAEVKAAKFSNYFTY